MTIQTRASDRKAMAKALAAFLGIEARYKGVPSYAYEVGPYTVNRDGSIDGEDFEAIQDFLIQEGFVEGVSDSGAPAAESGPSLSEEADPITETHVTIPLSEYTPLGLTNLLKTLYTHQTMIAAMTKSDLIRIDEELITRLSEEKPDTIESIAEILRDEIRVGLVSGIHFEDGKITMAFPFDESKPAEWLAYSSLMLAIAVRAGEAKHVGSKRMNPADSEMKYFCRNWLIQLGMGGSGHKEERRVLLGHLPGFAAFRTLDKMDAHKAKMAAKRKTRREPAEPEVTVHDAD